MARFSHFVLLLSILSLAGSVSAGCVGGIKILNIPDVDAGGEVDIVVYSTIPSSLGLRNLDVYLDDPSDNRIYSSMLQLSEDNNEVEFELETDNSFISGDYVVSAKLSVFDDENISDLVCEEMVSLSFSVDSPRKVYNEIVINMNLTRNYSTSEFSLENDILDEDNERAVHYIVSGIIPDGWNVTFIPDDESVMTSGEIIIDGSQYVKQSIYDECTRALASNARESETEADRFQQCEEKRDMWENLSLRQMNETKIVQSELNSCQDKRSDFQDKLMGCLSEKDSKYSLSDAAAFCGSGVVAAVVLTVLGLRWLGNRQLQDLDSEG